MSVAKRSMCKCPTAQCHAAKAKAALWTEHCEPRLDKVYVTAGGMETWEGGMDKKTQDVRGADLGGCHVLYAPEFNIFP